MKRSLEYFKNIPLWRVITAAVLLLGLSFQAYDSLAASFGHPSFQETILIRLNDVTTFSFYFILLLLIGDLGFNKDAAAKKENGFFRNISYIALLCVLFIATYIVFCLLTSLLKGGSVYFSDEWKGIQLFGMEWLSPSLATAASLLLFFLRLVFLACLVYIVNNRAKKTPFGYIGGFAVCLLDGIVYFCFTHGNVIGVFPFEHSYLESVFRITFEPVLDAVISVSYWLALIAAAGLIYGILNKRTIPGSVKEDN